MYNKKNVYTVIISIIISILLIDFSLRIIGFKEYEFKGYPPYYLTTVGRYDNFDIRNSVIGTEEKSNFIFHYQV